jgi:hypothetical protein
MIQSWGYSDNDPSNGNINIMSMSYDGANGIIDIKGNQSNGNEAGLLINWYCGKDVHINTNPLKAGNVTMTSATKGMVGIGTTPTAKLDVLGTFKLKDGTQGANKVLVSDADGLASWQNLLLDDGDWTINGVDIYRLTGNVGIGTTTPTQTLEVNGTLRVGDGSTNFLDIWYDGAHNIIDAKGADLLINYYANKNCVIGPGSLTASGVFTAQKDAYFATGSGNVGIGTDNPTAKLDVFGNIRTNYNQILLTADDNHGLGWFQTHAGEAIDGPVLYGFSGGALAIKQGTTTKNILTWKQDGSVNINTNNGTPDIKAFTISDEGTGVNVFRVMSSGHAYATELTVKLKGEFPDYVFSKQYALLPLNELENYISKHQHLPNVTSAKEVKENGLSIGEMQVKQMEKIEELTLYILELNNRLTSLEEENKNLKENK